MFFCILIGLGVGPIATARAVAQDPPPKAEPPKQLTPVPAPPDAQKESPPVAAPPDAQKESTPVAAPPDAQKESKPGSSEALSVRYLFTETYSPNEDPEKRYLVTQYRVGVLETLKAVRDKAQGAPERFETSRRMIYTERAAQVSRTGDVTTAVRQYDAVRTKEIAPLHPLKPPFLQGLRIWYHHRRGEKPQILSLSSDRPLRESEYDAISEEVFVPQLMALLPPTPRRVGDTWEIPRVIARTVWGELPDANDYELTGSLIEVRKAASGTSLTAVIGISGRFTLRVGPNSFNARIDFTFEPGRVVTRPAGSGESPKAADSGTDTGRGRRNEGIIDAKGSISHALMAQRLENPIPESDGRLKQSLTKELELWRQPLAVAATTPAGGSNPTLTIPASPPTADEANSWLVYNDPQGRFHFRHPQELRPAPGGSIDVNTVELTDPQLNGIDALIVHIEPKDAVTARDRQNRDPDFHRRDHYARWEKAHQDVVHGSTEWLPDSEWNPFKRKVYRIEAALKTTGEKAATTPRVYYDFYLVLFNNNESIQVTAMTVRDDHLTYRKQAETLIKNFQFGRAEGEERANPVTPSPSAPPSRPPPPRP